MEVLTWEISSLLADKESLSEQQFAQLVDEARQGQRQHERFADFLRQTVENDGDNLAQNSVTAMKTAQGFYALSRYNEAVSWLEKAGSGKHQCYLKACCLRSLGQYQQAINEFEKAEDKGYDSFDIAVAIVDCLRREGDLQEAEKRIKRISRAGDIRAEYHYQLARLHDANGRHEEAIDECQRAVALDADHTEALFHLAYAYDLYGYEDKAIDYYQQCVNSSSSPPVSALLNLAALYEDAEDYYNALRSVKKVLAVYPHHERAGMFLKDIESSVTMCYDEDQERRVDRRNKVLEIPISDFELSVRSRNCLRKMNIRNLADLLKVTESELLAYKNFGETSLREIKTVLTSKGLRLGQMLEETKNEVNKNAEETPAQEDENEVLNMTVTQLQMSVRSRKCLERLNINIVGDLIKCTEAELLGCKNFGMTSLGEIKQSLKAHNLSLRRLEE